MPELWLREFHDSSYDELLAHPQAFAEERALPQAVALATTVCVPPDAREAVVARLMERGYNHAEVGYGAGCIVTPREAVIVMYPPASAQELSPTQQVVLRSAWVHERGHTADPYDLTRHRTAHPILGEVRPGVTEHAYLARLQQEGLWQPLPQGQSSDEEPHHAMTGDFYYGLDDEGRALTATGLIAYHAFRAIAAMHGLSEQDLISRSDVSRLIEGCMRGVDSGLLPRINRQPHTTPGIRAAAELILRAADAHHVRLAFTRLLGKFPPTRYLLRERIYYP